MSDTYDRIDGHIADIKSGLRSLGESMDRVEKIIGEQAITLTRQQLSLDEHIRRTDAAERHLQGLEARVRPLEVSEVRWALLAKYGGTIAAALAGGFGLIKALGLGS